MFSLSILQKQRFSTDFILRSINRYSAIPPLLNVHGLTKCDVSERKPSSHLLQFQPFSTTKQLMSADHAKLWITEKAITTGVLFLVPAIIMYDNSILEAITALLVTIHMHWGFIHIQSDYLRANVIGPALERVVVILIHIISFVTLAGLLNLTFTQGGIGKAIKRIWTL